MQVLTTQCPYCHHEVDSTIEHLDGPVLCPSCEKPFEMEMPTAVVTAVHEVDEKTARENRMASEPEERTLVEVHPVVFRARPIATLVFSVVGIVAAVLILMSVAGMSLAGYALDEMAVIGPASIVVWLSAAALIVTAGVIGYWTLLSRFTTLTVTDDRTVYREGIVSRETSEVQHDDVRNIQLDQSFVQRLLNVGGIGISSSGQDDLEVVAKGLPHPKRIIDLIRENQD
ncbi:putative transmembrane protein [Rhodopirellula islandica]|uniref:Transmembrane protein n=1 Tax=Rhodopirellula islandica TaxID=595434 RepID=A0A0J1BF89_RHOIS|nr:PH domain-containing protein [Rhodopirellula islandica]KLU05253.1 putative transmembrane protein [Rhodopirellula islandica]